MDDAAVDIGATIESSAFASRCRYTAPDRKRLKRSKAKKAFCPRLDE